MGDRERGCCWGAGGVLLLGKRVDGLAGRRA